MTSDGRNSERNQLAATATSTVAGVASRRRAARTAPHMLKMLHLPVTRRPHSSVMCPHNLHLHTASLRFHLQVPCSVALPTSGPFSPAERSWRGGTEAARRTCINPSS